ncbi:hypothetical protein EV702DRAFT_1198950 [Suillus placidus]|uniref:Uncharacterized protein n=1 Tax=Suillus placidus TaxID=48579 RepID=A0A9P6ZSL4_9AGAM|nr:hypothetical protein EV702DRAFT_1198950 [Suillus placidus]
MTGTPPTSHQWPQLGDFNEQPSDLNTLPEAHDHGPGTESDYGDHASVQDHSEWQHQWWWTSLMDSPPQAAQDDLPLDLAHPDYASFYRETPPSQSEHLQPTGPHHSKPERFSHDCESELAAAESYYDQMMMYFGVFDAPVAEAGGSHLGHDSESEIQASESGSSQQVGRVMNSRLLTTHFDPPPRSHRYMPYPTPVRFIRPHASPIPSHSGNEGEEYLRSPMQTIPSMMTLLPPVTVAPQTGTTSSCHGSTPNGTTTGTPDCTTSPITAAPQAAPLPTNVMFGLEALPQVQFQARELLKTEVFKNSFLMSTTTSATLARNSFEVTVLGYQCAEITEWSQSAKGQAHVLVMTNTIKNLRDCIKNLIWTHVVSGYGLQNCIDLENGGGGGRSSSTTSS